MEMPRFSETRSDAEMTPRLSNIRIVQLTPEDWEILRKLKLTSLQQDPIAFLDYQDGMDTYLKRTEYEWRKKLDEQTSSTVYVFAEENGEFIGMVNARIDEKKQEALIQHLYVDPDHRGQMVGKRLLETLLQKLKGRGIGKAKLAVLETQKPAIRLYESLGFEKMSEFLDLRGDRLYKSFRMELVL
ncbi:hypothetical protein A2W45_03965 [Candidatus Curtissbacteria bacterium RIFCSPHIGHO2_12_41_11]|uniref:N-acetyltransferase domain-containing protein n=2 Tax=Candidatus Curtissiibacteriota TaxID=1752717 RepID=A0A1F5H999_9BACT|nr:MAG: hypothetical protein A3D07_02250 [Candidatus Curtissbacteria bacterium RIFCSPHIGHO2_02_FULL_42_15]OGE00754.1 MAG: hypothetical protein A2W45_03965 [Candidatus Curtissbacteria bacterium RIFCSPHIGHO2_12_41_11]